MLNAKMGETERTALRRKIKPFNTKVSYLEPETEEEEEDTFKVTQVEKRKLW